MKRLAYSCLAALAVSAGAEAHTLDEYVQALRVAVTRERFAIYLDLTAGANVAAEILQRVDTNSDGTFSPTEAEAYGRTVTADLTATLDDVALPLTLVRVEIPPAEEIREGQGVIRIEVSAPNTGPDRQHRLTVRNSHLPSLSAYLANALLPETSNVRIVRQTRDLRQQTFWLDYEIRDVNAAALEWLLFGGAGLAALVRLRSR